MLLKILGIFADIITILSLWDLNGGNPTWLKISCTGFLVLVAVIVFIKDSYIAKVVDYSWEEGTQPALFVKKNTYFKDNALVSIYMKEDNNKILAAIGFVIIEEERNLQINVLKHINDGVMRKIKSNKTSYKKFFVKPNVRYQDINGLNFR